MSSVARSRGVRLLCTREELEVYTSAFTHPASSTHSSNVLVPSIFTLSNSALSSESGNGDTVWKIT